MNRFLIATAVVALTAGGALAQDVKLGVSLGFTGPLESMAPSMLKSAVFGSSFGSSPEQPSSSSPGRTELVPDP